MTVPRNELDIDRYRRESAPWWVHLAGLLATAGLIILGFATWRQADLINRQKDHIDVSTKTSKMVSAMQAENNERVRNLEAQVQFLRSYIVEQARRNAKEQADPE